MHCLKNGEKVFERITIWVGSRVAKGCGLVKRWTYCLWMYRDSVSQKTVEKSEIGMWQEWRSLNALGERVSPNH